MPAAGPGELEEIETALLGFLAIGPGESMTVSPHAGSDESYSPEDRIYPRMS